MLPNKRRLSTVTQINPDTLEEVVIGSVSNDHQDHKEDGSVAEHPARRSSGEKRSSFSAAGRRFTATLNNFTLFKDDDDIDVPGGQSSFISAYITPGPKERKFSEHKKANLGIMLGVYLPTIQHILGVTMFIRLFWVVGIAGVWHTMLLLLCCCLCTLLTSISLSAVATNGVVESGGAYFMISRNLGVEFGSAVGILFYLANTVAASMYLVGGVEVMLLYIFPSLTIGGNEVHSDTGMWGMMSHNYRIYGTAFLLLEAVIVAMGVRFVQLLAPISLLCVILSILACFAGGIEKAIRHNGQHVCMLNNQLLQSRIFFPHGRDLDLLCNHCVKSEDISDDFCNSTSAAFCSHFTAGTLSCVNAFPGFNPATLSENLNAMYMGAGESYPGVPADDTGLEVSQDVRTSFFILLAIYFPAVTGIMTGTNMSGDLKDPQRSIPCGTIAATLTTSVIYYALAILFGASISGPVLRDKYGRSIDSSMIVASLSWPSPWVVVIGSFLSTFGAALQCLCSAPRLLQSIAKDDVIPALSPFARVTKNNEPFLGLLFTAFIAEFAILLGAVDSIAEVLDFFFLMCYAFVNLICALHSLLGAPNWRPRFKYYHWSLSVMGAGLCFFIMFASQWQYALFSILLTLAIYKYVEWKGAKKEWGDGIRGLALSTAQYSLMKVEDKDPHPKNWRPQLLVLADGTWSKEIIDMRCINMLNLAGQLKAGRGLAIVVAFVKGSVSNSADRSKAEEVKERIQRDMAQARLRGFGKTLIFDETEIDGCVSTLYQSTGIGGLKPNTVLINWPNNEQEYAIFAVKLIGALVNDECIMVTKGITDFPQSTSRLTGFIDIWWILHDGGILMLIAFLLRQHKIVDLMEPSIPHSALKRPLRFENNITATVHNTDVLVDKVNTARRLNQVILENSRNSQLVLLNLPRPPKNKDEVVRSYMAYMDILTENIPRVLFVGGSGKEVITISS
ncbi:Sodium/chloride cotransporter 3 [Toxocara canis]|uniref:Sodium/chloride cotransporter 3 n=1 Tax=Toxocara canis TaxID=6265 RepID=A0A0B2UW95_TOXCA|nr:Sodium/chloride cotransporter 3 [Toxocara canis]